jgi:CheY-like chemotaxis protein
VGNLPKSLDSEAFGPENRGHGIRGAFLLVVLELSETKEPGHVATSDRREGTGLSARIFRVLAIDDNDECLRLIADLLKPFGFEVCCVTSPVKALEQFAHERQPYDLVLLDYFMPHLNGAEMFVWLKRAKPSVKIILVSGAEELRLRQILAKQPFDGCIRKPFRLREALQVIRGVIEK